MTFSRVRCALYTTVILFLWPSQAFNNTVTHKLAVFYIQKQVVKVKSSDWSAVDDLKILHSWLCSSQKKKCPSHTVYVHMIQIQNQMKTLIKAVYKVRYSVYKLYFCMVCESISLVMLEIFIFMRHLTKLTLLCYLSTNNKFANILQVTFSKESFITIRISELSEDHGKRKVSGIMLISSSICTDAS